MSRTGCVTSSRGILVVGLLGLIAPVSAVDWTQANFGDQPMAIGAGPRALGMGGAFSAVADDGTASTWNPAGLTQCELPEVAMSGGWYSASVGTQTSTSEQGRFALDHVSLMTPLYVGEIQQVVGLAWQRQYDFTRSFEIADASLVDLGFFSLASETHQNLDQHGSYASLGACYAIEPLPGLSFGLTANTWGDRWTHGSTVTRNSHETNVITTSIVGFPDDTNTLTIDTATTTRVASGWNVVLGSWWQATPAITIAVVAKPQYRLHLESNSSSHQVEVISGTATETDSSSESTSVLTHPSSLTLGAAWRRNDILTVTLDVTATRWSQYQLDDQGTRQSPVNIFIDPNDFDDLWTIRAGYEYMALLSRVILVPRFGLLYEELPASTRAPSLSEADQVSASKDVWMGMTTGLSAFQRNVVWDVGLQWRYGHNVGAGQLTAPNETVDVSVITARFGVTYLF